MTVSKPSILSTAFHGDETHATEFFSTLSHPIRIRIVRLLHENIEMSYSDLRDSLGIEEGLLNFHLRKLKNFLGISEAGSYILSQTGRYAVEVLSNLRVKDLGTRQVRESGNLCDRLDSGILVRRVAAFLLDTVVLAVSTGIFLDRRFRDFVFSLLTLRLDMVGVETISYDTIIGYSHIFFAAFIVFTILEAYRGQTIGKYVCGIRVVKRDGRKATLVESAIRNLGKVFFLPIDITVGLIFYARRGYIRFFDFYTEQTIERAKRI